MDKKENSKILQWILSVLFSTVAAVGFFFLSRIAYEVVVRFPLPVYIIPFAFLIVFYKYRVSKENFWSRRKLIFAFVISFLLAMSLICGYQLRISMALASGLVGKIGIIVKSGCLTFVFLPFCEFLFALSDKNAVNQTSDTVNKSDNSTDAKTKIALPRVAIFFISWALIFIGWLPVFLAYYPGIMSYDSNRQFNEAYNNVFWELQPIIHTFMIRIALLIGEKHGDYAFGVALYSLLQIATLSLALGYLTSFLYKLCNKIWVVIVSIAFYIFLPTISVLSLCVTKDIIFSAFFIIFICAIFDRQIIKMSAMHKQKETANKDININSDEARRNTNNTTKYMIYHLLLDLVLVVSGALMMQFRKNAVYGLVFFFIIFIISEILSCKVKKNKLFAGLQTAILCAIILFTGFGFTALLRASLNAGRGPAIEKYSVIIQQFSRVAYLRHDELNSEEKDIIDRYLPNYSENPQYNFSLADGPKYNAKSDAFNDTNQLIKDWMTLGKNYPADYLDAYLGLTLGYYFTDDISISQYLGYGRDNMRGLIETFNASKPLDDCYPGVEANSKLPGLQYFLEGIVSNEEYLVFPPFSLVLKPAFYCWAAFICLAILLYKKRYRDIAISSLQITYFLTVLLGPVANIRYAFQIILAFPLFLVSAFYKSETTD